jgi:hypothetical protein
MVDGKLRARARSSRMRPAIVAVAFALALGTGIVAAGPSPAPVGASAAWVIQPHPRPNAPRPALLNAVTCVSPTSCVAVGDFDTATSERTLVEHWNGSSWAVQDSRNGTGAVSSALASVSCPTATMCLAVGAADTEMLAEKWNGSIWSAVTTPTPSGGGSLAAVSCVSTTSCEAVGFVGDVPAALRWNGSTWSTQTLPGATGAAAMSALSCASATSCVAVGRTESSDGFDTVPLAYRWNGTTWARLSTPAPGDGFSGVSCPTASQCTAVGTNGERTLVEQWNGVKWSVQASPSPDADGDVLMGIDCASATACDAVGNRETAQQFMQPLVEHWNGTTWSVQSIAGPAPNSNTSELDGVACVSAATCFAAGTVDRRVLFDQDVLVERTTGGAWAIQSVPHPVGSAADDFLGVACPAATSCTAVGTSAAFGGVLSTLVDHWNGSAWALQSTPNPAGGGEFSGVACPSTASCFAVGSATAAARATALVERWNGTAWSISSSPTPAGRDAELAGVACTSPTSCIAVGDQRPHNDSTESVYALRWNGTVWAAMTPLVPSGGNPSTFKAVSCATATDCEVVGYAYGPNFADGHPFIERWNGTTWSTDSLSEPGSAFLTAVACVHVNDCTAVGNYIDAFDVTDPLVERWNGTTWSHVSAPSNGDLDAVTCVASTDCTAVGELDASILHWNGVKWAPETPAPQAGEAYGVACPTGGKCVAVGFAEPDFADGNGGNESTIERAP